MQVGRGIKLPAGADDYTDYFYDTGSNGSRLLGPVDRSIQLGDGGTGITAEVNAFYHFTTALSVYANFYYLANPRNENGISTARGGTPSAANVANGSDIMSVLDRL